MFSIGIIAVLVGTAVSCVLIPAVLISKKSDTISNLKNADDSKIGIYHIVRLESPKSVESCFLGAVNTLSSVGAGNVNVDDFYNCLSPKRKSK